MKPAVISILCALVAVVSPVAAAAQAKGDDSLGAQWRQQQDEARAAVRQGRYVPLGKVIETIRSRAPGRQLDAGLEAGPGGREVYRVRWAGMDGRRTDYLVDAVTGSILRVDNE